MQLMERQGLLPLLPKRFVKAVPVARIVKVAGQRYWFGNVGHNKRQPATASTSGAARARAARQNPYVVGLAVGARCLRHHRRLLDRVIHLVVELHLLPLSHVFAGGLCYIRFLGPRHSLRSRTGSASSTR